MHYHVGKFKAPPSQVILAIHVHLYQIKTRYYFISIILFVTHTLFIYYKTEEWENEEQQSLKGNKDMVNRDLKSVMSTQIHVHHCKHCLILTHMEVLEILQLLPIVDEASFATSQTNLDPKNGAQKQMLKINENVTVQRSESCLCMPSVLEISQKLEFVLAKKN